MEALSPKVALWDLAATGGLEVEAHGSEKTGVCQAGGRRQIVVLRNRAIRRVSGTGGGLCLYLCSH